MSESANPINEAQAGAARYTSAILAKLGDREPFGVLRDMPAKLARLVLGLTPANLVTPEAPGKWSALQVVHHLADSELVGGYRFRLILAADRPELVAYDQDRWVERVHRGDTNVDEVLADFGALRRANLRLLESTSAADRERFGVHAERGRESLGLLIRLYAGHDLAHLAQLERIRIRLLG